MTREQLDQANSAVIRKWGRTIADMSSAVPRGLLDDLAVIAGQHAADAFAEAVDRQVRVTDDTGHPVRPDGTVIPETAEAAERRAARTRKTTTR